MTHSRLVPRGFALRSAGVLAASVFARAGAVRRARAETDTRTPSKVTSMMPWQAQARSDPAWLDWHRELARAARAARARALFIGDSLSARWLHEGREVWTFDPNLRGAFTLGIGGDTTQNVLYRIRDGALDGLEPALAFVMIGVNDIDSFGPADVARGIVAVLDATHAKLPNTEIYLFGVLPRGVDPASRSRRDIAAINENLGRHRYRSREHYLDITRDFVDANGVQRSALFDPDTVHLNVSGYARWASVLDPIFERTFGKPSL